MVEEGFCQPIRKSMSGKERSQAQTIPVVDPWRVDGADGSRSSAYTSHPKIEFRISFAVANSSRSWLV